jgi:hypothetical protein
VNDDPSIDAIYAHLLELLIEHRCNGDEIDNGGDQFAGEIMRTCAQVGLMKIEEFGPLVTGRLTAEAVDLILAHCDEGDVIDTAVGLEALEPMPREQQLDLQAVSERRMSMKEFNNKWVPMPAVQGDEVAQLMMNEGISAMEAMKRCGR